MIYKTLRTLRKGEWVIVGNKEEKLKGKFSIGRVKDFKIEFEEFEKIDLDKGDIEVFGSGEMKGIDGVTQVLNNKEIKSLNILRTKLKTLKNLEDNKIKEKYV